ncbi:MAG: alanine--tRNA ligase [Actinomycetota bacterium]
MEARQLRKAFRDFFVDRGHEAVASASLIPHDPTVMFTVAGMVPFKPYFVGEETPPYNRAVTVQKCARAGGKHNDLDEIGRTKRHLTFFEMMGNFSFGDYFKEDAIPFAWEFVTEVLGLDPERLWVTVHLSDDEAEQIWIDKVGVRPERVQRLDEDNYWKMADTGPNGPCSEIFFDMGDAFGEGGGPAYGGDERFLEIWNLVFMQYETKEDGTKILLPAPSIDTGAGLERILTVLQGVESVFEIDEMKRLVDKACALTGVEYGADESRDVSVRILAEHSRAMTFLISDGVFPSNEERGYVLRRIMRRAIRHAYLLGAQDLITPTMIDEVVEIMGPDYPEIVESHDFVRGVVEREEESFRRTLKQGSVMLDTAIDELGVGEKLAGTTAFTLHDTYGFPLEVTAEIAAERDVEVDIDGFEAEMSAQQERGRADHAAKSGGASDDVSAYVALVDANGETEFLGRDDYESTATVLSVTDAGVILDRTPFYSESGGQIGDTGTLVGPNGSVTVTDTTYAVPGLHLHHAEGAATVLSVGDSVTASIDVERRRAIMRNHTGTHLLHHALREVLGDHVKQQGSWVGPDRLRFDFSHYEAMTAEQMQAIEDIVAEEILANPDTEHVEMSMADATEKGAIAFFGDKYGEQVRVLQAGPNSIELCGGTHVGRLGDIGPLKILSEGSIGSNIRRVEAVTGTGPLLELRTVNGALADAAGELGVPVGEVVDGARKKTAEIKSLRDEIAGLRRQLAVGQAGTLAAKAVDGVVVEMVEGLDRDGVRDLACAIRDADGVEAVVLGAAPDGGGVALVAAAEKGGRFHAGNLIADAAKLVKGGGGKGDDLAVAGGKDPEGLSAALEAARASATEQASA